MRDREGRFALHEHRLRRYSAGPENRRLAVADLYRVAEVGLANVFDADRRGVADMYRRAVHRGEPPRREHRLRNLSVLDRTHADDHRPGEAARRLVLNVRDVHRHVAVHIDMADGDIRLQQRALKAEGTAEQESYKVVLPVFNDV